MNKNKSSVKPFVLAISAVILVVCVYAAYYAFLYFGYEAKTDADGNLVGVRSGTFGDAFGALNALFSGLAFSGFMITLLLQRRDLSDGQAENARQQIESQFYNMLKLQQAVVSGFDLQQTKFQYMSKSSIQVVTQGRDCFKTWADKLRVEYDSAQSSAKTDKLKEAYRELWDEHRGDLSLYFRSLYTLFKFVSKSDHVDKKWLSSVARSFISDYELIVLFYNCLMPNGLKFQAYACEFAVFDNLDVSLLLNVDDVLMMSPQAFGDNPEVLKIFQTSGKP